MKWQVAVSLFLAGLLTASLAAAQNQPSQAGQKQPAAEKQASPEKQAGAEKQASPEKKDALYFIKIATDVAGNVQPGPLNGFLGLYIDQQNWASALKDSDLGPFVKVKEAKPGRSAACLFSAAKDAAICVYFDADTPFGVAAVKAGASGKIEAGDVSAAYKPISKDMLKKGDQEFKFTPGDAATDDGQSLPAYVVTTSAKAP